MSVYASGNVAQQQQRQQHQQRLGELLEAVKQEFDFALNEASNFKQVKEDYDLKYNQQTAEMQQIRQTVFELEMAHRKIKEAYEEEILRLKTELENRDRQQIPGKANGAPFSYIGHQGNQHLPLPAPLKKEGKKDKDTHTGVTTETSIPPVSAVANSMPATLQKAPDTSTGIPVIDKTQYVVDPLQKALHIKEIPPFLCDLDVNKAHPDFKKQKPEYYVLFNPAFSRELDVELVHSLDHSSVVCCVRFSKNGELSLIHI